MSDHHVEFHAPHAPGLASVRDFLQTHQRLAGLQHLQDVSQVEIERRLLIDERSTHCCLYRAGRLVAVVRLTPAPFEAGMLNPALGDLAAELDGHLDFSRLVASPDAGDPRRVTLLLAHASRRAWLDGFDGTTALARAPQRRLYQRFGLRAVSEAPCRLATRGDAAYWLLRGEWREIARAADAAIRALARAGESPAAGQASPHPSAENHHV